MTLTPNNVNRSLRSTTGRARRFRRLCRVASRRRYPDCDASNRQRRGQQTAHEDPPHGLGNGPTVRRRALVCTSARTLRRQFVPIRRQPHEHDLRIGLKRSRYRHFDSNIDESGTQHVVAPDLSGWRQWSHSIARLESMRRRCSATLSRRSHPKATIRPSAAVGLGGRSAPVLKMGQPGHEAQRYRQVSVSRAFSATDQLGSRTNPKGPTPSPTDSWMPDSLWPMIGGTKPAIWSAGAVGNAGGALTVGSGGR